MEMTDREICWSYKNAENQKKHVQILADLNDCQKHVIVKILQDGGYPVKMPKLRMATDPKKSLWTDEKIDIVIELYREGKTNKEIAAAVELSPSHVGNKIYSLLSDRMI